MDDVLKDNDLADSINSIYLEDTQDIAIMLKKDSDFLKDQSFLDYSLLLFLVYDYGENGQGYEDREDRVENLPFPNNMNSFTQMLKDSDDIPYKRYIYFGIIDYITTYNTLKKQLEV